MVRVKGLSPIISVIALVLSTVAIGVIITELLSDLSEQQNEQKCTADICIACKNDICGAFVSNTTLPQGWNIEVSCKVSCNDEACLTDCNSTNKINITKNIQLSGFVLNISKFYGFAG